VKFKTLAEKGKSNHFNNHFKTFWAELVTALVV
jgi:hypothetical protein